MVYVCVCTSVCIRVCVYVCVAAACTHVLSAACARAISFYFYGLFLFYRFFFHTKLTEFCGERKKQNSGPKFTRTTRGKVMSSLLETLNAASFWFVCLSFFFFFLLPVLSSFRCGLSFSHAPPSKLFSPLFSSIFFSSALVRFLGCVSRHPPKLHNDTHTHTHTNTHTL